MIHPIVVMDTAMTKYPLGFAFWKCVPADMTDQVEIIDHCRVLLHDCLNSQLVAGQLPLYNYRTNVGGTIIICRLSTFRKMRLSSANVI